ncbi:MAG: PPK2 family polyphosphate kinase [Gammaproteobacteria bacterium]
MFNAIDHPYLVPFDGSFKTKDVITSINEKQLDDKEYKKKLKKQTEKIHDLQRIMYAHDCHSLLLVFQAMDAAGKDSTIRHVLTGVNPAGCQVFSFKQPSDNELDHDYLWRTTTRLPERGRIGVFNRSYYEEVLVVRVHPEILNFQKLPDKPNEKEIWSQRYESIRSFEKHLAHNGTVVLKFWLNVSKEEQCNRFLSRIDEPEKNWKFSESDIKERGHWDDYMKAYEKALSETSRSWAPWYSIPADNKPYMRYTVAKIIAETMESLNMHYPRVDEKAKKRFDDLREMLVKDK